MSFVARGRRQLALASDSGGDLPATITLLASNVTRMAPAVVHANAVSTTLIAGDYHTSRFQWTVTYISGPGGWTPLTCLDPRPGLQEGDTINSATECEGFNFAFFADVAGTYRITLTVTDEDYNTYTASTDIVIAADTRTALYVSGTGNDTTGDGSIGNPWRQPSKAWDYIVANGKDEFSVLLERGYVYGAFNSDSDSGLTNIVVGPYGSGAVPIVQTADNGGNLLSFSASEAVVVMDVNFRGTGESTSDDHPVCISISDLCVNIGMVRLTFGGAGGTDYPNYCVQTNAVNERTVVPTTQGVGYAMFNCSGHSQAYFMFVDGNDTGGYVNDSAFTPTTTEFEVENGLLSAVDDAYNGMHIVMLTSRAFRNIPYEVSDYVASSSPGRCKFTLSSPVAGGLSPNTGDLLYVVEICEVGEASIFMFGCENEATANRGNEARFRCINSRLVTMVGTLLDGSTTAPQQKGGPLFMVDFAYMYRSASVNAPVGAGAEVGSGCVEVHQYQVYDRSYAKSTPDGTPIAYAMVNKVVTKSCVLSGAENNSEGTLLSFSGTANSGVGVSDLRVLQCTTMTDRQNVLLPLENPVVGVSGYPDSFLTMKNNLLVRGSTNSHQFMTDYVTSGGAWLESKNNVYTPSMTAEANAFYVQADVWTLSEWNARNGVGSDVFGSISLATLTAADFIPNPAVYIPETTNAGAVPAGVFQDYYGQAPSGWTFCGAVGKEP